MTASVFPTRSYIHKATGARVTGDLVVETSTAWQVAVTGKVRLILKSEWDMAQPLMGGFEDIFSQFTGR